MKKKVLLSVAGMAVCLGAATVSVDKVQQRYPWNGMVDIDYTISYEASETPLTSATGALSVTAVDGATPVAVRTFLTWPLPTAAGRHRITWNATADGCTMVSSALKVSLALTRYPEKYLVVDLSNGVGRNVHSVEWLDAPPEGGFNTDEYKTCKMAFRLIPAGTFMMGSPVTEVSRGEGEAEHAVTISKPFYMSIFEFTRGQFKNLMGREPNDNRGFGEMRPLSNQSYTAFRGNDANPGSLTPLGILSRTTGLSFELPTEAQWEWACRAGTTGPCNDGSAAVGFTEIRTAMARLGRTSENASAGANPAHHTVVGSFVPNAWGLYDMHGNVREFARDRFLANPSTLAAVDPIGVDSSTTNRVARGGCFSVPAKDSRSASRVSIGKDVNSNAYGFRLVVTVPGT